ncbi:MAG: hypothetical protein ABI156_08740 [Caldimonas sp.]
MNKRAKKVDVAVEELKHSSPLADGSGVVLETESSVDGHLHDTSIEVQQEDVPAVAVALLNTDAGVAAPGDPVPPAIRCLGAGVVHGVGGGKVRVHLQFDSGQVLPIEMSKDAAFALCRGLFEHTGAAARFDAASWGLTPAAKPGPAALT